MDRQGGESNAAGIVRGRVWRFGDNIDTDVMAPFATFIADWETTRPALFPNRPGFSHQVEPGDVIVAGGNWGCGSSREQAPANLKKLGIAAVVAESFGRIFFRNAIAIGLPCMVCPEAGQIAEGDVVKIDVAGGVVRAGGKVLTAQPPNAEMLEILRAGGLLNTIVELPRPEPSQPRVWLDSKPKTMAEKILARAARLPDARAGSFVTVEPDCLVLGEFLASCISRLRKAGVTEIFDPAKICVTLTGMFPAPTPEIASLHTHVRQLAERLGIENFFPHDGIINQVAIERGQIRPGELAFGSDSHSTTYGAMGAAGAGLGITELAYLLARGRIWTRVPETIRFVLTGEPRPGVMSKDIILHLLGRFGSDYAQYRAIEFAGPLAARMSLSSRMTLSNMSCEMGAKFAMFEADEVTLAYLRDHGVADAARFGADKGADYLAIHEIDVSAIAPQAARPNNPSNVSPVSDCAGTKIQQAFLGSCTNARLEDLAVAAAVLRGKRVAPGVRLIVTPVSQEIMQQAAEAGYVTDLVRAGAHFTPPGCGACSGSVGGVVGPGETCISTTNRNFQGRMGSPDAQIYLASPATVAASAIAGEIVDPLDYWPDDAPSLLIEGR
jgi:3-isopropylmalate/(R)-2-methylmalate dehydratase large subunit